MRVLSVTWNENRDVTKIRFTEEFQGEDWIVKADVLKDLIYDLTSHYDALLDVKSWEERNEYRFQKPKDEQHKD